MEDFTFTSKALAAIVAADEAIVLAESKAFGAIVAKYCEMGTKVRALPNVLDEDGTLKKGVQAKLLEAAPEIAQSRMSRSCTIAARGKEGYEAYREACKEEGVTPTLTGLMTFYKDSETSSEAAEPLTGQALVKDAAEKAEKALLKKLDAANLNTRQRKAAIKALIADLEAMVA